MPLSSPTSYNNLTLDSRLKSFTKSKSKAWPHNSSYKATPDTLARAGFAFTPDNSRKSDRVTCFVCGKTLGGWEPEDDPFKEHAEHSPACSWALARCSIEALRVSPESTDLIFPDEESLPSSATLEAARLATFGKLWPHDSVRSHSAKSKHMAKAGFIYTPTQESDDLASCFYCNLGLDGWESTDDPHHEHQRRRPQCAFFSARVSISDEPESQPKRGKSKASKKPQPEDIDDDDEQPPPPPKPKKGTSTGIKRTGSKSSKAAPSDPDATKQEPGDDPPSRNKLRKSQSHGQLQSSRSTLAKSTTQPERSQSALGRSVVGRTQSRLGHRAGVDDEDDEDDEPPPVPAKPKPKATAKSKKAAPAPEPDTDDPEPVRAKTKTRSKKPVYEVDDDGDPEPEPKTKPRVKGGKAKAKAVPEPEPELEVEEEDEAPPPPPPKTKTKTKAKATTTKGKKGAKKVVEDPVESSAAEMEVESGMEIDSAPEPVPKKTRAKKPTAPAKKTTRGKKAKAKAGTGDDTESQVEPELEDVHMQSYSEAEPPATSTPRPLSRPAPRADENTPRTGAGPNANAKPSTGLPVLSRSTPSPSRLARPGTFGTPRAPSQPGSASNTPRAVTPRAVTVGSGIARPPSASGIARPPSASGIARPPSASGIARPPSASGIARPPSASGIARPPSSTGIPRPGTTTPGSAGTSRTGLPIRQPSPTRPGVARPVFGALNRNNSGTDVVMASPGRPAGTPSPSRPAIAVGSPTRLAAKPLSQVQQDIGSSVPFPRESSPMTPGRPMNPTKPAIATPTPAPASTAASKTATTSNGPAIDMSLAELDAETRALTLEAYVRREMQTQYEALKAECEKEIEDFLKAASETRAKITAL
ncbi:unnamed protein product [Rhizoctonia solani]|uniref:Protein bir1 n=1 Tax=Rhizoctonia solani TaxID=456999 RepID=A0A8H3ANL0_9AGAM|nr:unnamed protein product [Rhizoctonia solani]